MSRPQFEVADIIRSAGTDFIERNRSWLRWTHLKILRAIACCRTAALGGHVDECSGAGATISYNWCRNRHCPKCQNARGPLGTGATRELLPTLRPRGLHLRRMVAPLALPNQKTIYTLLFRLSAETLGVARDPRISARTSVFSVSCTPGTRNWNIIRIYTPWFPKGASLSTIPAGSGRATASFFPRPLRQKRFAASSSMRSSERSQRANCGFPDS